MAEHTKIDADGEFDAALEAEVRAFKETLATERESLRTAWTEEKAARAAAREEDRAARSAARVEEKAARAETRDTEKAARAAAGTTPDAERAIAHGEARREREISREEDRRDREISRSEAREDRDTAKETRKLERTLDRRDEDFTGEVADRKERTRKTREKRDKEKFEYEKSEGKSSRAVRLTRQTAADGGRAAMGAARNDAMPAFEGALKLASSGLEMLGPYGMVASKALAGVGEAAAVFKMVIDSFAQRAKELERLSPDIAAASARADIRRMQTDLQEADEIGPQLGKLVELQSKGEAIMSATLLPIKEFLLENINDFLEWSMSTFADFIEGFNDALAKIGAKSDALTKLVAKIHDIMNDKGGIDPLDLFLKAGIGFAAPAGPIPPPAAGGLAAPIVGMFLGVHPDPVLGGP